MDDEIFKTKLKLIVQYFDDQVMAEANGIKDRMVKGELLKCDIDNAQTVIGWFGREQMSDWLAIIAGGNPEHIKEVNDEALADYNLYLEKNKKDENERGY